MAFEAFLLLYWPLIIAAGGIIVWAVRLEGRIEGRMNKADTAISALWKQREEDKREATSSRSEVLASLHELSQDIKHILKALGERR